LRRIRDYIASDSPLFAHVFVDRLTGSVTRLRTFPRSGRVVPEFGLEHIRELIVSNYRIVYRVRGDTVEVTTVFHSTWSIGLQNIEV
jgi:plasmid stabilization system protein ParE